MTSEGPEIDRNAMKSLIGDLIDELMLCRESGWVNSRVLNLWSEILDAERELSRREIRAVIGRRESWFKKWWRRWGLGQI